MGWIWHFGRGGGGGAEAESLGVLCMGLEVSWCLVSVHFSMMAACTLPGLGTAGLCVA